jgi:hypothetical protein
MDIPGAEFGIFLKNRCHGFCGGHEAEGLQQGRGRKF